MRFRCFACGRFTDEVTQGPTADEAGQVVRWTTGVLDVHVTGGAEGCRAAVACWSCFWRTEPAQWIRPEHWDALPPVVPYARLPMLHHRNSAAWDPASYPWPDDVPPSG